MQNKRKHFTLFFLIFFVSSLLFSNTNELIKSETYLVHQIQSSYKRQNYAEVIINVDKLEKEYSNSSFLSQAKYKKARSLYLLGRFSESYKLLKEISEYKGIDVYSETLLLMASIHYIRAEYKDAIEYYHQVCQEEMENKSELYYESLLYSVRSLFQLNEYQKLIPIAEYLITCSNLKDNLCEVTSLLFASYDKVSDYKKIARLYKQTELSNFPVELAEQINLVAAKAYTNTSRGTKALEIYESLLGSKSREVAGVSLHNAFVLATEVSSERAEQVVEKASSQSSVIINDKDFSSLLGELRIRVGIDDYKKKDYQNAQISFSLADELLAEDDENRLLLSLYKEKLAIYFAKEKTKELYNNSCQNILKYQSQENPWYYSSLLVLCEFECKQENYKKAEEYGALWFLQALTVPPAKYSEIQLNDGLFWYSYSLGSLGKAKEATEKIEKFDSLYFNATLNALYARFLLESDQAEKAIPIFRQIALSNSLDITNQLNYVKASLKTGNAGTAYQLAKANQGDESIYLAGIAAFAVKKWQESEAMFLSYLRSVQNKDENFLSYARYYCAYAQYRQENYSASIVSFKSFIDTAKDQSLVWNAYQLSAQCALHEYRKKNKANDWLTKACDNAIKANEKAILPEEKNQSLLLLCGVYTEMKKYNEALELLKPFMKNDDTFAMSCLYQASDIQVKAGNYKEAEALCAEIVERFPKGSLTEEADFRRGEILFFAKDYVNAEERFRSYRENYLNGYFYEDSLYYGAISCTKNGEVGQGILLYEELVQTAPNSNYASVSWNNLLDLYYQKEEYASALQAAKVLQRDFSDKINTFELEQKIVKINLLIEGVDERTAQNLSGYTQNGQEKTEKGRSYGFELAEIQLLSPSTKDDGAQLMLKMILACNIKSETEQPKAARGYFLLGGYYREKSRMQDSSTAYLKAAQYYSIYDEEKAANSLYCAIEAFAGNKQYADAKSTYEVLKTKYKNSSWVKQAEVFIEE